MILWLSERFHERTFHSSYPIFQSSYFLLLLQPKPLNNCRLKRVVIEVNISMEEFSETDNTLKLIHQLQNRTKNYKKKRIDQSNHHHFTGRKAEKDNTRRSRTKGFSECKFVWMYRSPWPIGWALWRRYSRIVDFLRNDIAVHENERDDLHDIDRPGSRFNSYMAVEEMSDRQWGPLHCRC